MSMHNTNNAFVFHRKEAQDTLNFLKGFFGFNRAFREKMLATW